MFKLPVAGGRHVSTFNLQNTVTRSSVSNGFFVILSLLVLRTLVGFHFFSEGMEKVRSGNFDASGFLLAANGPAAPFFRNMADDPDHSLLLCVDTTGIAIDDMRGESEDSASDTGNTSATGSNSFTSTSLSDSAASPDNPPRISVSSLRTIAIWNDFADECASHYRFGDAELVGKLQRERETLAEKIRSARQAGDRSVDTAALEFRRAAAEQEILAIRTQPDDLRSIVETHGAELQDWLAENRTELIEHFATSHRTGGFDRDQPAPGQTATEVDSLRKQRDEIAASRQKKAAGWSAEVREIWNSFEHSVNGLRVDEQSIRTPVPLHRPHDQPASAIKWINRIIPLFDVAVGVMLVLGLFPRLAALAAALFLASVVATQPPWIPGTADTWPQTLEMVAMLVLATRVGSQIPGLGWLLGSFRKKPPLRLPPAADAI